MVTNNDFLTLCLPVSMGKHMHCSLVSRMLKIMFTKSFHFFEKLVSNQNIETLKPNESHGSRTFSFKHNLFYQLGRQFLYFLICLANTLFKVLTISSIKNLATDETRIGICLLAKAQFLDKFLE